MYSAEYREALAAATSRSAKDRFVWFCGLVAMLTLVFSLQRLWADLLVPIFQSIRGLSIDGSWHWQRVLVALPDALTIGLFGVIGWRVWVGRIEKPDTERLARALIHVTGAAAILMYPIYNRDQFLPTQAVFLTHFAACAIMPWRFRDALRVMYPLLALGAAVAVFSVYRSADLSWRSAWSMLTVVALAPLPILPGAVVAHVKERWRTELFRTRFFEERYGQLRAELIDARRVHEALFPKSGARGTLRFDYRYEPMRQIGGDFLFARWDETIDPNHPRLNVVLIDVTGHGISSALTVNRLAGELERLFAEDPAMPPGRVLAALNRYVYLTMSQHGLFCTAMCMRVEPDTAGHSAMLRYASGGHPPIFIRAADTAVRQIDSTSLMLGVLGPDEFDAGEVQAPVRSGDVVVAVTDGAVETRSATGELFGEKRLASVVGQPGAGPVGGWAAGVLAAVDSYRAGPPSDDTVVVAVAINSVEGTPPNENRPKH